MLSRRWMRLIASAKSGATETTVTFSDSSTGCVSIESVREPASALGKSGVGSDDDGVLQILPLDRRAEVRQRVEVIDRYTEEALDLRGVQVERYHAIRPRCLHRVGADARADRDARLVFLVALRVAEVRDDHGHRVGTRPREGVDPEEQFHEVRVRREDRRLHEEDASAADVLQDPDEEVAVGEPDRLAGTELDPELAADGAGQAWARAAREDQRILVDYPASSARRNWRAAQDAHAGRPYLTRGPARVTP